VTIMAYGQGSGGQRNSGRLAKPAVPPGFEERLKPRNHAGTSNGAHRSGAGEWQGQESQGGNGYQGPERQQGVRYPGTGQQGYGQRGQQSGYGQGYGHPFSRQQPTFSPQPQPTFRPPQAPQASQRSRSWPAQHKALTGLFVFVALTIVIVAAHSGGSLSSSGGGTADGTQPAPSAPAAAAAPKSTRAAAAAQTVTYEVTGSSADVTYGPAGSTLSGTVPMKVTAKLGDPIYYSLQAQLQGGGSVTVEILVNGIVISQGTASGGYNIATAEISQDPLSGQWTDTDNG
jgi:hypothetical protein